MKTILFGLLALAAAIGVLTFEGCYQCDGPDCRNLPPVYPDYPPTPSFGADLERACDRACARLRAIGCPEGSGSMGGEPCTITCQRAVGVRPLPIVCWADAGSSAEAKACGGLRCIR